MSAFCVAVLSLVVVSSSLAQQPYTEEQVVAYAKSIDVNTLDPSLPSQRLEDWLQFGPPQAQLRYWLVADTCDLKPDSANENYPLCAEIRVGRNGQWAIFLVQVGTFREGIVGEPRLYSHIGAFEGLYISTGGSERLSDLPALLSEPVVADGVQKLYEEIVAHRPIGIPSGAQMAAIRPYLSNRLAEQLQTALRCQDDYSRQHPKASGTSGPGWLKSGLFSGEGSHASPVYAVVNRKEKQNDGSFLVYVDLADRFINLGHRRRAFRGNYFWQVEARVVPEKGQFVVDDVRIFDHFPTEGLSRLLSNLFAGCDGSHWIGVRATHK